MTASHEANDKSRRVLGRIVRFLEEEAWAELEDSEASLVTTVSCLLEQGRAVSRSRARTILHVYRRAKKALS